MRIPRPRIPTLKKAQGKAGFTQDFKSPLIKAAMAKAKGTKVEAKPKKRVGGWMVIQ